MSPEEFEEYFPHHCKSADDVAADVSTGKAAVPTSGFHQLLVVREGEESALREHQADQEAHLLAASSRGSGTSSSSGSSHEQQQRSSQQSHLQQQGSQHIDIPHQHAPAAEETTYSSLEGAKSLPGANPSAVVVEEDGVANGHGIRSCSSHNITHRSVFGLPTIPPNSSLHAAWLLVMLFVDLTYTAFINPVLIVVGWIQPFNEVRNEHMHRAVDTFLYGWIARSHGLCASHGTPLHCVGFMFTTWLCTQ
jgi:hypothetical protein